MFDDRGFQIPCSALDDGPSSPMSRNNLRISIPSKNKNAAHEAHSKINQENSNSNNNFSQQVPSVIPLHQHNGFLHDQEHSISSFQPRNAECRPCDSQLASGQYHRYSALNSSRFQQSYRMYESHEKGTLVGEVSQKAMSMLHSTLFPHKAEQDPVLQNKNKINDIEQGSSSKIREAGGVNQIPPSAISIELSENEVKLQNEFAQFLHAHVCKEETVVVSMPFKNQYLKFQCEKSAVFSLFNLDWQLVVFPKGSLYAHDGEASVYLHLANDQLHKMLIALVVSFTIKCGDVVQLTGEQECFRNGYFLAGKTNAFSVHQVPYNGVMKFEISMRYTNDMLSKMKMFSNEAALHAYYDELKGSPTASGGMVPYYDSPVVQQQQPVPFIQIPAPILAQQANLCGNL